MTLKSVTALLSLSLMFGTSCIRRTVTPDFGLTGITPPPRSKPQAAKSPDASLRAVFKQQTEGAFNPLKDDRHLMELQVQVKSNPPNVAARLELASAYERYRLYDSALDQYKEAIALLPATDVLTANAWNRLGLLYEAMASLSAAQSAFEHAVAANSDSDSAHNNLGYSLLLQSKVDAAEPEFRKAVELNPGSSTARNNLASVLARRGDLKGALEQFLMTADAATAHNNLAVVLLEAGRYEQSREQLVEALNIRHYFAPALANFKIVQERLREEAEVKKYGRLPLNPVRAPSALVALEQMTTQEPEDTK